MKPSERNRIQAKLKAAKHDIDRCKRILEKFTVGTLPHNKIKKDLSEAESRAKDYQEQFDNR